mmetsp:Transcript_14801/g.37377  ORF Transcript_14801/g.37377 Transcript_14801/m.37377 type:complete len:239 (-) Transcript_14801:110-826(-)
MVSFGFCSDENVCAARSPNRSAMEMREACTFVCRSLSATTFACSACTSFPTALPSKSSQKNVSVSLSVSVIGAASSPALKGLMESNSLFSTSSTLEFRPAADHAARSPPPPPLLTCGCEPAVGTSEKELSSRMLEAIAEDSCMEVDMPPDFCSSPDAEPVVAPGSLRAGVLPEPCTPLTRESGVTSRAPSQTVRPGCAGSGTSLRGPADASPCLPGFARDLERTLAPDLRTDCEPPKL